MGGLCVFTGIAGIGAGFIAVLFILVGLGLLAWHFVPPLLKKRTEQKKQQEQQKQLLEEPWNCPYCGASTKGMTCEYCDSPKPTQST